MSTLRSLYTSQDEIKKQYIDSSFLWLEGSGYNPSTNIWSDKSLYNRQLACQGGSPFPTVTNGKMRINTTPVGQGFVVPNFPILARKSDENIALTILATIYPVNTNRVDCLGNRLNTGGIVLIVDTNDVRFTVTGTTPQSGNINISNTLQSNQRLNLGWSWNAISQSSVGYLNGSTVSATYSSISDVNRGANSLFIGFPSNFSGSPQPVDISFVAGFLQPLSTTQINQIFNLLSV